MFPYPILFRNLNFPQILQNEIHQFLYVMAKIIFAVFICWTGQGKCT